MKRPTIRKIVLIDYLILQNVYTKRSTPRGTFDNSLPPIAEPEQEKRLHAGFKLCLLKEEVPVDDENTALHPLQPTLINIHLLTALTLGAALVHNEPSTSPMNDNSNHLDGIWSLFRNIHLWVLGGDPTYYIIQDSQ
ncbi:15986_t:CDS:2, partial [Funneliformis caledonium]